MNMKSARFCFLLVMGATFANSAFSQSIYPLNPRFERLLPDEDKYIDQIREGILFLQAQEKQAHGKSLRGTHAKGVCLAGEMEIYDVEKSAPTVSARLKKGIFSVPGKYLADIRFANAKGEIHPDHDRDVRAVSFALHMPSELSNPQGRMDFTMNDATTFPINDAQVFADLMMSLKNGFIKTGKEIGVARVARLGEGTADGKLLQEGWGSTPFQKKRYWSTVPFALGDDEAVKYSLSPCSDNPSQPLNSSDSNELRNELIRHVDRDKKMSCFEFQVQLLEPGRMTRAPFKQQEPAYWWVENAEKEWNEDQAPFYSVGKLTLKAESIVDDAVCETRWISVTKNNNVIHHGLGSINRARDAAESASANVRLN
jgi:Catalase